MTTSKIQKRISAMSSYQKQPTNRTVAITIPKHLPTMASLIGLTLLMT